MRIAIPFAIDITRNPNLQLVNYHSEIDVYFKVMCVSAASLRRVEPTLNICLVLNKEPPKQYLDFLSKLNVNLEFVAFEHKLKILHGKAFSASFYLFDAILNTYESTLFLDPDIICFRKFAKVLEASLEVTGSFDLGFPEDRVINGMTHKEAKQRFFQGTPILEKLDSRHMGGEILYIPRKDLNKFKESIRLAWQKMNQDLEKNYLPTEEHMLSCILAETEHQYLNSFVRRVWTTKSYTRVEGGKFTEDLFFWHLPSEKDRGFIKIWRHIEADPDILLNMSDQEFKLFIYKTLKINEKYFYRNKFTLMEKFIGQVSISLTRIRKIKRETISKYLK